MSDQADHQMEGIDEPVNKGKGKAPQAQVEESADDDSSDESGVEDQTGEAEPEDEDNMEEIDPSNIVGKRTRGKTIDYEKANQELGAEEDEEDEDDDYKEDDAMEE